MQSTRTTYLDTRASGSALGRMAAAQWDNLPRLGGLAAIVLLAAVLRFTNLYSLGYANSYYAATVRSMLESWHNFFFVAAEPGGAVSVDKPPVGFWLQAISARIFGVDSLGLMLPQIVAGIISVVVVYHLVRRSFGTVAGLLAGLALAITPVVVATDRNNTIDSTLILTLLLAAWAFIVATERGSPRHLLLGAFLVGVGFNIKMMEAYLPLPAFYALYFLGSKESLRRKLGNLTIASVLLVVVSLSWATIVDLTPADQRPYVGSSGDNSELSLAIGYNGVERLIGMGGRGGLLTGLFGGQPSTARTASQDGANGGQPFPNGGFTPPSGNGAPPDFGNGTPPQGFPDGRDGGQAGPAGGGGMFNTGQAGPLRLFTSPLSKEMSWLLPFGIFGALLLAFRTRLRWPIAPKHQALVLWGGWLLTGGIFFSIAGFFHQYYLSTLAPPLAALVGIGTMELWGIRKSHRWLSSLMLLVAAGGTLAFQVNNARAFTNSVWWVPLVLALLAVGAGLLIVAVREKTQQVAIAGFVCVMAAILVTPGIWSGMTSLDPSTSSQLPEAWSGQSRGQGRLGNFGGGESSNTQLLSYLEANTQGVKYLVAVSSSNQGAGYVLATGRPVLYMGGFSGQDKVVTVGDLSRMAADGEIRYILWGGGGPGGSDQSDISAWITANCKVVQGVSTQSGSGGGPGFGGGTLYEVTSAAG